MPAEAPELCLNDKSGGRRWLTIQGWGLVQVAKWNSQILHMLHSALWLLTLLSLLHLTSSHLMQSPAFLLFIGPPITEHVE
jgi:hypothetical protein